jgi:hypothetical protein
MGKTRFSSLDVTIAVRDLRSKALGLRVANVYDINARTYLIKLARPVSTSSIFSPFCNFNSGLDRELEIEKFKFVANVARINTNNYKRANRANIMHWTGSKSVSHAGEWRALSLDKVLARQERRALRVLHEGRGRVNMHMYDLSSSTFSPLAAVTKAHPHQETGRSAPARHGSRRRVHIRRGQCAVSLDYGALRCGTYCCHS